MIGKIGGEYEYGKLYRSEDKVYPREVKGRFATLRRIAMFVLLGAFYVKFLIRAFPEKLRKLRL